MNIVVYKQWVVSVTMLLLLQLVSQTTKSDLLGIIPMKWIFAIILVEAQHRALTKYIACQLSMTSRWPLLILKGHINIILLGEKQYVGSNLIVSWRMVSSLRLKNACTHELHTWLISHPNIDDGARGQAVNLLVKVCSL